MRRIVLGIVLAVSAATFVGNAVADDGYARDPQQPVDAAYTAKIAQYTTAPEFNSPLTDYLPASASVPTPAKVLGDIAGAPDHLPYSADVYRYFDALAAASPRVKVFRIGKSEEGRDMIAVAIADEPLLKTLDANTARLAQLADPRTLGMDDAKADALVAQSTPVYYITGTIHSVETGAPTALMELAYRLAVDDAPYIRNIRSHVITLITPIVEVDGRDRMVDLDHWHHAHPGENYPPLMYWGHYVAHDNNRDAMGLSLNLSRNVLDTYLGWHAQVLHDLHESVPFLYDNTVGAGPYNAWIDPILVNEWQMLGWDNVQRLTKFGMPGVFAHGEFDTWSPGYLMFMAAMHNGISRLYETFGNGVSDTQERILAPNEYARTWYKPNPPLPKVLWSLRDNNNYEQTGLLTALDYFAANAKLFLHNFYLKSKHSIEKPTLSGPAAYVFTATDPHPGAQAELLRVLALQHVELHRADAEFSVQVPAPPKKPKDGDDDKDAASAPAKAKTVARSFPAGSVIVRMDQPYSRIADVLLDRQYWAPDDPQKHPYDDTGWTFGALYDVDVARVTDAAILRVPMQPMSAPQQPAFAAATFGVNGKLPRIALMHTWLDTQTEGWWRLTLDRLGVKYDYISTQSVAREKNLRGKYDVILFAPIGGVSSQQIVDGLPMYGNPLPWQKTALTPNIGRIDSTPDIRPGLGEQGLAHLKRFVADGGLLVTSEDTAKFAIDEGLAPGVSVTPRDNLHVVGDVLRADVVDMDNPIARGYGKSFTMYSAHGLSFRVSNLVAGGEDLPNAKDYKRPTGRGGPHDTDQPEGRAPATIPALPDAKPWQALPLNAEQERNNPFVIPQAERPNVIVRWADADDLLVSGLLEHGEAMAQHAAVVQTHYGRGRVLLFASNPLWRGETIGSYTLLFNAIQTASTH
ncbi:MAG: M14 family zinc carboxypeptidase [Rudaea sp.]